MRRDTFVTLLSAILLEADDELVAEAQQHVEARRRFLKSEHVACYDVGQLVSYKDTMGNTREGTIGKLNKYSVTIRQPHPTTGFTPIVVDVDRIITPGTRELPF